MTKKEVEKYLYAGDMESLVSLARDGKKVVNYILRCLYSADELLRKRAIEALGLVCSIITDRDPAAVRNVLRQLLWSVTEESGGIGWSAPEAMAEIVRRRPDEFFDYGTIAVSFLDEELLRKGGLWAAGTLAGVNPGFVERVLPVIESFLKNPDPTLRGYAARVLYAINPGEEKLEPLKNDFSEVQVYENGELTSKTVAELAGYKN